MVKRSRHRNGYIKTNTSVSFEIVREYSAIVWVLPLFKKKKPDTHDQLFRWTRSIILIGDYVRELRGNRCQLSYTSTLDVTVYNVSAYWMVISEKTTTDHYAIVEDLVVGVSTLPTSLSIYLSNYLYLYLSPPSIDICVTCATRLSTLRNFRII